MYLWKFEFYNGRAGKIDGLFVATYEEVTRAITRTIYLGEALGKHSDVYGDLKWTDIKRVDIDPSIVEQMTKVLGKSWCGYNPLEYLEESEEEEE